MVKINYLKDNTGEIWITVCQTITAKYRAVGLAFRSPRDQHYKCRGKAVAMGRMRKAMLERKHARPVNRVEAHGVTGLVMLPEHLDVNFGFKSQFYVTA